MPTVSILNTVCIPREGVLNRVFPLPPKMDIEKIYYAIDISNRILDGDEIVSARAETNDNTLEISNIEIDSTKSIVTFMVSGGMPNQVSVIWFLISTKLGEARQVTISNSNISPNLSDNAAAEACGGCDG